MDRIKIGNTDIFLEDYGEKRGKIIISDTEGYNFSYYWGSMGSNLKDFLLSIDEGYFVDKLCTKREGDFSGEKTVTEIRKHIREELSYELPWYKNMEAMKELRYQLKNLENCDEPNSFIYECNNLRDHYWSAYIEDRHEVKGFQEAINSLFEEPWYFFQYKRSNEQRFLKDIFKKLKKELKSLSKLEHSIK